MGDASIHEGSNNDARPSHRVRQQALPGLGSLRRISPTHDAIIEEIDGRRIRIGDQWLIDFASCNCLGFDLDAEITDAVAPLVCGVGNPPELVKAPRRPGRARNGSLDCSYMRGRTDAGAHHLVGTGLTLSEAWSQAVEDRLAYLPSAGRGPGANRVTGSA
jgi:hypothetical protein